MPLMTAKEYAALRKSRGLPGGTGAAVTYACQTGRIQRSKGLIDSDQADKDWIANTNPVQAAANVRATAASLKARGLTPKDDRTEEKKVPPPAPPRAMPTVAKEDFQTSRANREFYESELARLKYEEKEGTLVPSKVVSKVLYEAGRIVRAGHDEIVAQLSPELAPELTIQQCEVTLKNALDKIDNLLADRIIKLEETLLTVSEMTEGYGDDAEE